MQEEVDLSRALSIRVEVCVLGLGQRSPAGDSDPIEIAWFLFGCMAPLNAKHSTVGPGDPCMLRHISFSLFGETRPSPVDNGTSVQSHSKASPSSWK